MITEGSAKTLAMIWPASCASPLSTALLSFACLSPSLTSGINKSTTKSPLLVDICIRARNPLHDLYEWCSRSTASSVAEVMMFAIERSALGVETNVKE